MANSPQAIKRARQAVKRNANNTSLRSNMRTQVKKARVAITDNNKELATTEFKAAQKKLDQSASKGIVSKKRVARLKSRMNKKLKEIKA